MIWQSSGDWSIFPVDLLITGVGRSINASGHIAGSLSATQHAFFYNPDAGGPRDIGTLGGPASEAAAINDFDQVVGASADADGNVHAFFYWGLMHDLGTLGGHNSRANSINAARQVVGAAQNPDGDYHAFFYDVDAMTDLEDLNDLIPADSGWVLTEATSINDAGQIVGNGFYNGQAGAFLLTPSTAPRAPAR